MGDGVNLASRLEGLNKIYGTTILVSGDVRAHVGEAFVLREVDRVAVKGRSRAVSIYELVGHAGDPAVEARRPALAEFERALHAAFARRFTNALEILTTSPASPALQDDRPTHELRRRLETWLRAPPPADWDGTWTATSK
jgi:adenylate cyclase